MVCSCCGSDARFSFAWNMMSQRTHRLMKPYKTQLFTEAGNLTGTVAELGSGFGDALSLVVDPKLVEKLYLVEPNQFLHEKLMGTARGLGLTQEQTVLLGESATNMSIPYASVSGLACTL